MADFVIQAPDAPTLQALAQGMGFWDATNSTFITQGPAPGDPNPQASYFLNVVGVVDGQTGYWARLRINGLNPFASGLLAVPAGITIYPEMEYEADGVTPVAGYAQPAEGVIA